MHVHVSTYDNTKSRLFSNQQNHGKRKQIAKHACMRQGSFALNDVFDFSCMKYGRNKVIVSTARCVSQSLHLDCQYLCVSSIHQRT